MSRVPLRLGALAVLCLSAVQAGAATIRVPQDAATVQAGVDLAAAGDTVVVDVGSWNEAVVLNGRTDLNIKGTGITATFMQAPGVGPAFSLNGCSRIMIEGFHLSSTDPGGDSLNGAISLTDSTDVTVHHCFITRQAGNGIVITGASLLHAYENVIVKVGDDAISFRSGTGGGDIHDNTFADNGTNAGMGSTSGIGVWTNATGPLHVFNNISWGNDYGLATQSGAVYDHDYNLVGNSSVTDYFNLSASGNERSCDPGFVNAATLDYHITSGSCAVDRGAPAYAGISSSTLDMDLAPRPLGAAPDLGADEVGCMVDATGWQSLIRICEGDTARLDASVLGLPDCPTTPTRTWTDDGTAPAVRDVSPIVDTTYEVTVTCPSMPGCSMVRTVLVDVDQHPKPFVSTARDLAPCNSGIVVEWEATVFHGPGGRGTYAVYRSTASCAAARAGSALVSGLTTTSWVDASALPGTAYYYAIEAEDDSAPTACTPIGPANGGATTLSCITAPATDLVDLTPPTDLGAAVLRARHVGEEATMMWPTARPLLADEHFHLIKTYGRPTGGWFRANPEGDLSLEFTETDTSYWLQCFLIRAANACETESP